MVQSLGRRKRFPGAVANSSGEQQHVAWRNSASMLMIFHTSAHSHNSHPISPVVAYLHIMVMSLDLPASLCPPLYVPYIIVIVACFCELCPIGDRNRVVIGNSPRISNGCPRKVGCRSTACCDCPVCTEPSQLDNAKKLCQSQNPSPNQNSVANLGLKLHATCWRSKHTLNRRVSPFP